MTLKKNYLVNNSKGVLSTLLKGERFVSSQVIRIENEKASVDQNFKT